MKQISRFLILLMILSGCSINRYRLSDKGKDKNFLIEQINDLYLKGQISKNPILVIDGTEYVNTKDLNLKKINLTKKDIKEIELLKKDAAKRVFGELGERGVLLITTKSNKDKNQP